MKKSNIILDIDGVICDFVGGMYAFAQIFGSHHLDFDKPEEINTWNFFSDEIWQEVLKDPEFWVDLKPLKDAHEKINFVPAFYLTARPCSDYYTKMWLDKWKFPASEVLTVSKPLDKVHVMEHHPKHVLVDDHIDTVQAVIKAGSTAVLYKAPYQANFVTNHLPIVESIEEVNLLSGAMAYREYREKLLNDKS